MTSFSTDSNPRRMNRVMTVGSRGNDVRALQDALRAAGQDPGTTDGIYGRRTATAVRNLQQQRGLEVDGVAGRRTQGSLKLNTDSFEAGPATAPEAVRNGTNAQKLQYAMRRARELGLTITSTTGGRHAPNSYHYRGRAVDVAGSPSVMRQFYREMSQLRPTELFHDPMGGMKHGRNIGAIGGHGRHVHVAF
ncbi:MAG: peptidoglycan-binding protein [Myxococcaceae bacterium]|nr:peptidoglycan-binding protein [Myxococcaceae bacterium]